MNEVSIFRLYVLRAAYLLIVVGVGTMIWPLLLGSPETAEHFRGVTWCLLSTVALLALLGIRYPLKMLPSSKVTLSPYNCVTHVCPAVPIASVAGRVRPVSLLAAAGVILNESELP